MGTWDIDPEGVRGVLINTGKAAQGFEGEIKGYGTHMEAAATNAGTLAGPGLGGDKGVDGHGGGLVAVALSQFAQARQKDLEFVVARTSNSLSGAGDATMAYVHGDLHMAADAQANALKAPDLSVFDKGNQGNGDGH